jgi:ADP-ribose pyrophosphatase YjhB (NUDIX family)
VASSPSPRDELQRIADEIRSIADAGMHWSKIDGREYDQDRFARLLRLSARAFALTDTRNSDEILRLYSGDPFHVTPKVCAEAAVFDDEGRLLLGQRADSGLWCIPGGWIDVNETAAESAAREIREETGVIVAVRELISVLDNRFIGGSAPVHAYHFTFRCDLIGGRPGPGHETLDARFFAQDDLPPMTPGHIRKVDLAFRHWRGELTTTYFDHQQGCSPLTNGGVSDGSEKGHSRH